MKAHAIRIDGGLPYGSIAGQWHRWTCSCGRVGDWTRGDGNAQNGGSNHRTSARRARNGGARHVAAMERK